MMDAVSWIIVGVLLVVAWICARIERKLKQRDERFRNADYEGGEY